MDKRVLPRRIITIKTLKDFILDYSISEEKAILLSQEDFDNIVLEYREFYGVPLEEEFYITAVLIKEAPLGELKQGQIGIVNKSDVYSL